MQAEALAFDFAQIGVEAGRGSRRCPRSGCSGGARASAMMCGIEAEALRDVDAGGGSGDADAQFVGGGKGFFVEANGGVEDAGVLAA